MNNSRLEYILEMLKSEPNDSFLNYALALEYAKEGTILKAVEIIELLLTKNKNYLGAYYQLGNYYEQLLQTNKALEIYQKGVIIAQKQGNKKTEGELKQAILLLEDLD